MIVNMAGEIEDNEIVIRRFNADVTEERIDVASLSDDFSGHGGGDVKMIEEFLDVLSGEKEESPSMESHYCALAAEESRLHGGRVVELDTFRN